MNEEETKTPRFWEDRTRRSYSPWGFHHYAVIMDKRGEAAKLCSRAGEIDRMVEVVLTALNGVEDFYGGRP